MSLPESDAPQDHARRQPFDEPPHLQEPGAQLPETPAQSPTATPELAGSGHWRSLGWVIVIVGAVFLCFIAFCVWFFNSAVQVRYEVTEVRPDAIAKNEIVARGWPESIHRVIQARASGFNHCIRVTIYGFDPRDVQQVKARVSRDRAWQPGYGSAADSLREFKGRIPTDVYIDATSSVNNYLFLDVDGAWPATHIIDSARGIYYCIAFCG